MMATVLVGGTVVTSVDCYRADVRLDNGRIAAIGVDIAAAEDIVLDAAGCYLFPGGIDPHTHFDLPVGQTITADDFASGTAAAAVGGTTTILDFATQNKGESLLEALANWHDKADGKCYIDYGFHLAISDWNEAVQAEMTQAVQAGVTSFKLYMAYKDVLQVDDGVLLAAMQAAKANGALICLHCENGDVIAALVQEALAQECTEPKFHALTRPAILEGEAVNRAICLAHIAEAPLYVVHVSCADALAVIQRAQQQGWPVYGETCPQYLLLDESKYQGQDFEAAKFVISPPLRAKENQPVLWQGLKNKHLATTASDHCSFNFLQQKALGRHAFNKIPNGAPGVENRFGLLYTYGVCADKLTLKEFVAITSTNAAKLFGLFPAKGTIEVGSDADIVVWDPVIRTTITAQTQVQRVDYNAYEGFSQVGKPRAVYLRGQQIVEEGRLIAAEPSGRYIKRQPIS
ncbi:dihydropyrimidinase [Sporomusaceae bacterium FL31]|nr:dihydropyrimidinase [Sporomusaceae bacterium FL31]GCE34540.1 dihydropyrimidinase [Sporomusaceae bacterium]